MPTHSRARANRDALYASRGTEMSACKFGNETSVPTPRPVASTGAVDRPDTTDPTIEDAGEGTVPAVRICPRKGAVPGRTFGWRGVFMLTSDSMVRGIAGITGRVGSHIR